MVTRLAGQYAAKRIRRCRIGPAWVGTLWLLAFASIAAPIASAQQPPPTPPPSTPPQVRYWTTDWSFPNIDINSLLSRLQAIGIVVPIEVDGIVSVDFSVSVPLTRLRDGKAYRLQGTITSKRLRVQRMVMEDLHADVAYRDGVMTLKPVRARWSDIQGGSIASRDGTFAGGVSIELLPLGYLQANLQADDIPIESLHDLISGMNRSVETNPASKKDLVGATAATEIAGVFDGQISARAPLRSLRSIDAWEVTARLAASNFRIGASRPVSIETGPITIRKAVLKAERLTIVSQESPEARVDAGITADLQGTQKFEFSLRANDGALAALSEVTTQSSIAVGKIDLKAHGEGELAASKFAASGQVASPKLSIAGVDLGLIEHAFEANERSFTFRPIDGVAAQSHPGVVVQALQGEYTLADDAWILHRLSARMMGGNIEGSGSIARKSDGVHRARLVWNDIGPQFGNAAWLQHTILARTTGQLDLSAPADSVTEIDGALQLQIAEVLVGQTDVGRVNINAEFDRGAVKIVGDGHLFGGDAQLDLSADDFSGHALSGQATVKSLRLRELSRLLGFSRLDGRVSATVDLGQASDTGEPQADIKLTIAELLVDGRSTGSRLDIKAKMAGPAIVLQSVQGGYAGGRIQASGSWSASEAARQIQVSFTNVDLNAGLSPWLRKIGDRIGGKACGMITLTGDQRLRVRGLVSARQGTLFGIPTGDWTSEIRASGDNDLGRWELRLPTIRGNLASGRIRGDAMLKSSSFRSGTADLSSRWQLDRIDFGQLLGGSGGSLTSYAHGRLTGDLMLAGRGIRSSRDLSGRFSARFGDTQSAAVPGLLSANRYLGLISLTDTRFTTGAMDGVIGGGIVRLDELWLRSNRARVWAEGKVQLDSRRMDMDVVISTGNFVFGDDQIVAFATQLALQTVMPITGLIEVNRLLSNRTIHLAFTGSPTNPRVQLKPLDIIREEAARFLLREILVAASISSDNP